MPEERKLVSILFADVTGSTALSEMLDAEDVRALMRRYYEHAQRIIPSYGGTLEKFIGDAVMSVFGLSQAHDDDAERALAAALALRDAIAGDEILSPLLRLRIGVNTGKVVASSDTSSGDFLVTGDAVNVSARLQQGAEPGEILASERTVNAARNAFFFGEERQLQAKGKSEPLRVFPLIGPRAKRQIERPPFVGRRMDLLQLEVLKERVREERRPQFASLVAPAGTGKTRLLEEFLARLDPLDGFKIAYTRCLPYGQTLTFWPLRGLLTDLLGSEPDRSLVQSVFVKSGYHADDAARLADVVLTTLGSEDGGETVQSELSRAQEGNPAQALSDLPAPGSISAGGMSLDDILEALNKSLTDDHPANWIKLANPITTGTPTPQSQPDPGPKLADLDDPDSVVDPWLKLAGLGDFNSVIQAAIHDTDGPPDPQRLRDLGQTLKESGKALGDAIRENVYRSLREGMPTRSRATDRESVYYAWRLLIVALATQAPHIIVFEDLHCASDNLLDLVEHIIHPRTAAPLLVLALSRPELLTRRPAWGGRPNFTTLALQPLGDKQIRELITGTGQSIPEGIRAQIVARSGGNPFFALELLHTFSEHNPNGSTIASLPDTVYAAILARMDLLTRQERSVLQAASVVGRAFHVGLLEVMMENSSEREISSALDGLVARDMIVQVDDLTYDFRHILLRDVAYSTLSRAERIRLHSKIALWLETFAAAHLDAYIELIVYHYTEAIQLARQSAVPVALPFNKENAALLLARAGVLAGHIGSYAQATKHFQLAIDFVSEAERTQLYEQLGDSVLWGSIPAESYRKALQCWRAIADKDPVTGVRLMRKVLMSTRMVAVMPPPQAELDALRQEALALVEVIGDQNERRRILVSACFDFQFQNASQRLSLEAKMNQIRNITHEAITYFEQQGNQEALSEALHGYSDLSMFLGKVQDAFEAAQRRLTIPNLPEKEWANAVNMIATQYLYDCDFENCIDYAHKIFSRLKPGQPIANLYRVATQLAEAAFFLGRWEEAEKVRPQLDEIRELIHYDEFAVADLSDGYIALLWTALAHEDRPRIDEIASIIRKDAVPLGADFLHYFEAQLSDDPRTLPERVVRGNDSLFIPCFLFLLEHGKPVYPELAKLLREAAGMYKIYIVLCDVSLALEQDDNSLLAQAIDRAEANKFIVHAARMRIVLAQRTGDRSQLERARPVLQRLGDRMHLRKLEEVEQGIK
ncbi:MAG TPA: adenylate/guanylate cyclase domain-containing protein [Ktedonobacteraceae bacterium]|nr:adenylate/guanylate cyclase domain-containing protein [Ktedonobacteraceae bacterium]